MSEGLLAGTAKRASTRVHGFWSSPWRGVSRGKQPAAIKGCICWRDLIKFSRPAANTDASRLGMCRAVLACFAVGALGPGPFLMRVISCIATEHN
ncbi:MAG: hypothetical protein E5Y30_40675, partial [Mesorhizobium sp.]